MSRSAQAKTAQMAWLVTSLLTLTFLVPATACARKRYTGGETTTVYTGGDYVYDAVWYTVEFPRTDFFFRVRACHSVYLALATYPEGTSDEMVEIALGVGENTESMIRYPFMEGAMFDTGTPGLLHCEEFREFWVSWKDNYIKVGRGPQIDDHVFMNWRDPSPHKINAVGLTSGYGMSAVWKIKENQGDYLVLNTRAEVYRYDFLWKSVSRRSWFSFMVRSCGDVHVVLSSEQGVTDYNVYEFSIGGWGNNRSVIRTNIYGDQVQHRAEKHTPGIVSCTEHREFWVAWMNGLIELGEGGIYGQNSVLRWKDPEPKPVRYLSLTTGWGNAGNWLIQDDLGDTNYIFTRKTDETDPREIYKDVFMELPKKPLFTFGVKACKEASILFADKRFVDSQIDVELIVGAEDNTKTLVRLLSDPSGGRTVDTQGILSCAQIRNFWLNWQDGNLTMGSGVVYGQNQFLSVLLPPPNLLQIAAISLATPKEQGQWRIRETYGERLVISTPSEYNHFDQVWRSVVQTDSIAFRLKACADGHVALSPTVGLDVGESYYDVIISGWDNTQSRFRRVFPGGDELLGSAVNTTGLLDCNKERDLWVSWSNSVIKMGRGAIVGHGVVLQYQMSGVFPVRAVALSTGWGSTGEWSILEDNGERLVFYPTPNNDYNWLMVKSEIQWLRFAARGCEDTSVYLATEIGSENAVVEVVLGAEKNTVSMIKAGGIELARAETPAITHCRDDNYFWIAWNDRLVRVGRGMIKTADVFMQYFMDQGLQVQAIGFLGRSQSRIVIEEQGAHSTVFRTTAQFGYHQYWLTVEHRATLNFEVSACSDVHLMLSDGVRHEDGMIDLFIGGLQNTMSGIRRLGKDYMRVNTPNINHCTEMRKFWLAWTNNFIEVGTGAVVTSNRILDVHILDPYPIRAIGFSTGYGYNGSWSVKLLDDLVDPLPPVTERPVVTPGPVGGGSGALTPSAAAGVAIGVICLAALLVVLGLSVFCKQDASSDRQVLTHGSSAQEHGSRAYIDGVESYTER